MEDSPPVPPQSDDPVLETSLQPPEEESSPTHRNWPKEQVRVKEVGRWSAVLLLEEQQCFHILPF